MRIILWKFSKEKSEWILQDIIFLLLTIKTLFSIYLKKKKKKQQQQTNRHIAIQRLLGGHGDCSMKLFGNLKRCYDGQWPLNDSYIKHCHVTHWPQFHETILPAKMVLYYFPNLSSNDKSWRKFHFFTFFLANLSLKVWKTKNWLKKEC